MPRETGWVLTVPCPALGSLRSSHRLEFLSRLQHMPQAGEIWCQFKVKEQPWAPAPWPFTLTV